VSQLKVIAGSSWSSGPTELSDEQMGTPSFSVHTGTHKQTTQYTHTHTNRCCEQG